MFKFFYSKKFIINLVIALLIIVLFIWGIFKFIDSYTDHGKTISVPSLEGMNIEEVKTTLTEKKLRYTILDSIFIEKADKGVVLEQNPLKDELVKQNRTIYITVSKVIPPKIKMPDIGSMSQRLAVAKLESYGLKVRVKYIPSEYVNTVVMQEFNDKEIKAGDLLDLGSTITLSIGTSSDAQVLVPYLINLTKAEARAKLLESALSEGFNEYENCKCETAEDTLNARVYRQSPIRSKDIAVNMGSSVDLYFTCDTNLINFNPPVIDTTEIDTGNIQ
jgi:beta-lactam-binding protein with PASTA domain